MNVNVQGTMPRADVLHDARFLIVGFLEEEAVVGDGLSDDRTAGRPAPARFGKAGQSPAMRPGGFEPPTNSLEGCCSIHLSYGREVAQIRT